jgi:hypothetical protein
VTKNDFLLRNQFGKPVRSLAFRRSNRTATSLYTLALRIILSSIGEIVRPPSEKSRHQAASELAPQQLGPRSMTIVSSDCRLAFEIRRSPDRPTGIS